MSLLLLLLNKMLMVWKIIFLLCSVCVYIYIHNTYIYFFKSSFKTIFDLAALEKRWLGKHIYLSLYHRIIQSISCPLYFKYIAVFLILRGTNIYKRKKRSFLSVLLWKWFNVYVWVYPFLLASVLQLPQ